MLRFLLCRRYVRAPQQQHCIRTRSRTVTVVIDAMMTSLRSPWISLCSTGLHKHSFIAAGCGPCGRSSASVWTCFVFQNLPVVHGLICRIRCARRLHSFSHKHSSRAWWKRSPVIINLEMYIYIIQNSEYFKNSTTKIPFSGSSSNPFRGSGGERFLLRCVLFPHWQAGRSIPPPLTLKWMRVEYGW